MPQPLLTAQEVAEQLKIGRAAVYKLVERGALPAIRIPEMNALRIEQSDVNKLRKKRSEKAVKTAIN